MATLGLKEMGKFLWEGREKVLPCWLSLFSFAKYDLLNILKNRQIAINHSDLTIFFVF